MSNSVVQNNHLGGLTANLFTHLITNIRIQGTTVSGNGGSGVSSSGYQSSVRVTDSTVSGNMGDGISSVYTCVSNSTVSGNMGTGIHTGGGSSGIDNSIITGNHDGGIFDSSTYYFNISNSTISGNTKKEHEKKIDSSGGGIFSAEKLHFHQRLPIARSREIPHPATEGGSTRLETW